jgi:hypothetical protein
MGATRFPNGITGVAGEAVLTSPSAAGRVAGGTATVTGATLDIVTGLATVLSATVVLGEDPGAGAGDVFTVSVVKHATPGTITVSIWQDDATAATEDTDVFWIAVGT